MFIGLLLQGMTGLDPDQDPSQDLQSVTGLGGGLARFHLVVGIQEIIDLDHL